MSSMHNNARKVATVVAVGGLALSLIGMGVGASFTDGATATQNISTGAFGCAISSPTPGAVVVGKTVTLNTGPLMSSAAGTAPLVFKVATTGTIPTKVSITQTTPAAPFTSRLVAPVADVTLNLTTPNVTYDAGLAWPELVTANAGVNTSVTYTVACTEVATPKFSALTGTAGHYDAYGSFIADTAPVVDMTAGTITYTIPVTAANSPTVTPAMSGPIPTAPQGRFVATPVAGNVSVLASVTLDSGLASQGSKFHAIYRSTSYGTSYNNLASAPGNVEYAVPFTGTNLAVTGWANNPGYGHNAIDNGLGVTWTGVTGTGTVTIVLAFSTN